jgi:hypothetical protein
MIHELRLTGACGKERTGFPQAGGPDLSEIPHPIDPEIWKRCYTLTLLSGVMFAETDLCDLYWTGGPAPTPAASGREL